MEKMNDQGNFSEIKELCRALNTLSELAVSELQPQVDAIIRLRSRDEKRIQCVLDQLLDYAGFEAALDLFKQLLRYYYHINPAETASYIKSYKELYDS